jgi:hypothetical protein
MDDDSTYYRTHYETNYASTGTAYDDVAPAYRYGNEMRASDTYRDRDWNDVEGDLKNGWHSKYGTSNEPSAWERIKAAVRHGWDKVTPDSYGTDDDYYRNDWNTTYASGGGSYDDYAPAYRYGSEARTRYSGRNWDDVETDLRSDWNTRYGKGGSTWEHFKAAVRKGWDKITPDSNDDSYYRNHWSTNYASGGGNYDDYAPAYRYGSEARTRYNGRNWDDVETDLRSDWNTRYAGSGASTWEKFKGAVRHGWDRVTS